MEGVLKKVIEGALKAEQDVKRQIVQQIVGREPKESDFENLKCYVSENHGTKSNTVVMWKGEHIGNIKFESEGEQGEFKPNWTFYPLPKFAQDGNE